MGSGRDKVIGLVIGTAVAVATAHGHGAAGHHGAGAATTAVYAAAMPNEALADSMAAGPPWHFSQHEIRACLNPLWGEESAGTWSAAVINPGSGAYGIPQALPAGKMASAGADWRTSPATQIRWGLAYIRGRYGTPCGAWSFERSHVPNWY